MPNQPKARGGRRDGPKAVERKLSESSPRVSEADVQRMKAKHPHRPEASLRNLRQWQKGQSGNIGGKSSSLNDVIRFARAHSIEALEKLLEIMRDPSASRRDQIQACLAVLDRGCGRPIVPIFKGEHNLPMEMLGESGADGEMTALLSAAKHGEKDKRRKELQAELARLDREDRTDREIRDSQLADAREAARNGQPLPDALRLLLATKNESE
jgi:hypothetical protein